MHRHQACRSCAHLASGAEGAPQRLLGELRPRLLKALLVIFLLLPSSLRAVVNMANSGASEQES